MMLSTIKLFLQTCHCFSEKEGLFEERPSVVQMPQSTMFPLNHSQYFPQILLYFEDRQVPLQST